jgi:CRP-like cAMP-binding protein
MSAKVTDRSLMDGPLPSSQGLPQPLEKLARWREFAAGDMIFHEHEQPDGFYVLRSGQVELRIMGHLGADFRVAICGPGSIIGLGASVSGRPRECTAEAVSRSLTSFVYRTELIKAMSGSPELTLYIDALLAEEVKRTQQVVVKLRNLGRSKR